MPLCDEIVLFLVAMEGQAKQVRAAQEQAITLQQMDKIFEEIDCFWLMWDDVSWAENIPSPKPANKYLKKIPFLPPIDFRPLVARNQFVSQTRLEDFMERIQQNTPSFSFLQTNTYGDESTSFVEETIHNVSSTFHGNMINKILPSPQHADYIDLLEDRRPSYGTALQMFTMTDEKQNSEAKGYSSTEFWRSFLGSRYSSMIIKVQEMQKWTRKNSDPSPILIFYQIASYGKLNFLF